MNDTHLVKLFGLSSSRSWSTIYMSNGGRKVKNCQRYLKYHPEHPCSCRINGIQNTHNKVHGWIRKRIPEKNLGGKKLCTSSCLYITHQKEVHALGFTPKWNDPTV